MSFFAVFYWRWHSLNLGPRTTGRIVYQNSQPDCFLRWYKLQRKASTLKSSVEQLGTFKETNWYGHLWVESDQIATVFKGVDKFPTNHVPQPPIQKIGTSEYRGQGT